MLAPTILCLLALCASGKAVQFVPVTIGPCETERELFHEALAIELTSARTPVESDFVVTSSISWNAKSQACYSVCFMKTEEYLHAPQKATCWSMVVKNFAPERAARAMAANIRTAIQRAGKIGLDGRD